MYKKLCRNENILGVNMIDTIIKIRELLVIGDYVR